MTATVPRSRLRPRDTVRAGAGSLRARAWRAALSGLGVAIGMGAAVAVLGVSASSRAALLSELGAEGNLLTVSSGQDVTGAPAPLPGTATGMIGRIPPVEAVSAVGYVPSATVRRSAAVPPIDSGGISVLATQTSLLRTLGGSVARGVFLNAATIHYPAVVLGHVAAQTLGIGRVLPGTQVYLGGQYFTVVGILRPVPLAPEIDEAALVGFPVADLRLGLSGHATQIYLRAQPDQVQAVAEVLPFTANPAEPEGVQVSQPSQLLAARAQARSSLTGLFLALGAVAVLIGGVGIANIMVISVLERRTEIGLRRAARRDPPAGRGAVPHRVRVAVGAGRRGRGGPRRAGHRGLRTGHPASGGGAMGGRRGRPRGSRDRRDRGRRVPGRPGRPAATGRGVAVVAEALPPTWPPVGYLAGWGQAGGRPGCACGAWLPGTPWWRPVRPRLPPARPPRSR